MTKPLETLEVTAQEALLKTPALITILIAGSDGTIDEEELAAGTNLTRWKTINARPDLLAYYQLVDARFENDVKELMAELPEDKIDRCQELVKRISTNDEHLHRLPSVFAQQLYSSWKELAKRIAEASGGVLGYLSIGYDESKLVNLQMLTPPQ